MISLGGSFAALPMMVRQAAAPVAPLAATSPVAPMFTPTAIAPSTIKQPTTTGTLAPDASHPTLCSALCPNDKLHCQADGTCLCSASGQLCYNPPPSTTPPPTYTDQAGNSCPPSAVDQFGMCPTLSTGTQQPYTDPNGVTCYPSQLDGYGYCPGSLQPSPGGGGGGTVTDGGGDGGYSTQPVPVTPRPIFVPQSSPGGDDGSQYASSQVPAPGTIVPVSTVSPYAWSQLSMKMKIAVVLLGVGAVGGGYYWLKRRRRRAIAA